MLKEKFTLTLSYEMSIDTSTGEILETKLIDRKVDKSDIKVTKKAVVENSDTEPKLVLESNKYILNSAAVELMNVKPNDRLDIKYEKIGNTFIPVIATDETFGTKKGNKVSKSNTVSYRGNANTELAKYGNVFKIEKHPNKDGLYILVGESQQGDFSKDENIKLPEDFGIEEDISLDDFIEETNTISAIDFTI